jgi:hypothetical protein
MPVVVLPPRRGLFASTDPAEARVSRMAAALW